MLSILSIQRNVLFKQVAFVILLITFSFTTKAGNNGPVVIPAGTHVRLQAAETVMSQNKTLEGKVVLDHDQVIFKVLYDVTVNDQVVIKAGTPVMGNVINSFKPRALGKPGGFTIEFPNVAAADNSLLALSGNTLRLVGKDKSGKAIGLAVVLSILLGIIFIALLAMKGEPAIIYKGYTKIDCVTMYDTTVNL